MSAPLQSASKPSGVQKRKKEENSEFFRKRWQDKSGNRRPGKPEKRLQVERPGRSSDPKYKSHAERAVPTKANEDATIDESIGKMDGRLLADYLAQRAKSKNTDLTPLELTDLYIPGQAFRDTSAWESTRSLENLPKFLQYHSYDDEAKLSEAADTPGSPHTIIITLAGLRAADLARSLREFSTKESAVAKLFAKHIKLKEAIESTQNTRMGIAIGTPVRLIDLVKANSLKLDRLKRIIIDGSHVDQKKRGIFDMKDSLTPLLQFLGNEKLRAQYGEKNGVEVLVY